MEFEKNKCIATGNIANPIITVGLNADNTVSVIHASTLKVANTSYISTVYIPISNKVLIAYFNEATNYSAIRVGTITENNIVFSEEIVISENLICNISMVYDSLNDKVVLVYKKRDSGGASRVVTIKDNTVLLSEEKTFKEKDIHDTSISATYDTVNGKVVIAYGDKLNECGYIILGTVTEDSIFFSDPVAFINTPANLTSLVYDSVNNKVVIMYYTSRPNPYAAGKVVTIKDDQVLLGNEAVFDKITIYRMSATYDYINNKVVVAYSGDYRERICVNLGTVKEDNIRFGAKTVINSKPIPSLSVIHDIANNKIILIYNNVSNLSIARIGTIEGDSILFSKGMIFDEKYARFMSAVYNSINNKVIIAYHDFGNSYAAIKMGTIQEDNVSLSSEMIFNNTNIRYISTTYDYTNNRVFLVYSDCITNGSIAVGTVNKDTIFFDKPVVFTDTPIFDISTAYIPANNKLIIAYRDGSNSYGAFVIATIEEDNVVFEKEEIFNNSPTYGISATHDSANNRVVIDYCDINNNYGIVVIYSNTLDNH